MKKDSESYNLASTRIPRLGLVVSTAWRRSSACIESPPWYFETLVFADDHIVEQLDGAGSARVALSRHCALVEQLLSEHEYADFVPGEDG